LRKRVKVEFQDNKGIKYTLAVEGKLSRDKVMKFVELMELMDGPIETEYNTAPDTNTFLGKILQLIETSFPGSDFSSSDLAREYEEKHNELVRLSTISTYLARLAERGYLKRQKFSNSWIYRRVYLRADSLSSK
jgi:hypothetical protein